MKLSKPAIFTGAGLIILLIIGLSFAGNYNSLVTSKNKVDQSWSNVQAQYQRRYDLIGNLVASVKGAQGQEKTVINQIAQARTQYAGAKSTSDQAAAAGNIESSLGRLLLIQENYPNLTSNQDVQQLMTELSRTENGVLSSRNDYNSTATTYNVGIQRFPKNIYANIFGFSHQELFKADQAAQTAPKVQF